MFCRQHGLFFHAKILARPARQPRNAAVPARSRSGPRLFHHFLYPDISFLLYLIFFPVHSYSFSASTHQPLQRNFHPTPCVLLSEENRNVSAQNVASSRRQNRHALRSHLRR